MNFIKRIGLSLLCEPTDVPGERKISLGRISFFAIFGHAFITWVFGNDIPAGELDTLWALMAYTFGTKIVEGIKAVKK